MVIRCVLPHSVRRSPRSGDTDAIAIFDQLAPAAKGRDGLAEILAVGDEEIVVDNPVS